MRTIQYGVADSGLVYSRVGSEVAFPVLDYDKMTPKNSYTMNYHLEKDDILCLVHVHLTWTRKVPTWLKNKHRAFWGFKSLKE